MKSVGGGKQSAGLFWKDLATIAVQNAAQVSLEKLATAPTAAQKWRTLMNDLTNIVLLAFLFVLCLALGVMLVVHAIRTIIRECKRQAAEREREEQKQKGQIKVIDDEYCVMCGVYIPQGEWVCTLCEEKIRRRVS